MIENEEKDELIELDQLTKEECEWCESTGDVDRTRRIYWVTVALIVIFIVIVYILALE